MSNPENADLVWLAANALIKAHAATTEMIGLDRGWSEREHGRFGRLVKRERRVSEIFMARLRRPRV